MKNVSKIIVWIILTLSTMTVCFSADANIKSGCSEINISKLNTTISPEKWIKELTNIFCSAMDWQKCKDITDNSVLPDYFDPNQSVFLTILCNSINHEWYTNTWFLNKTNFLDFIPTSKNKTYCRADWTMNKCDYAYYLPNIFNEIMNDMFSIAQARFFWISKLDDKAEDVANKFSLNNIPWLKLWLCDPTNTYYKTTCKNLKWYVESARTILKKTDIINISLLQEEPEGLDCLSSFSDNILYCGLLWESSTYGFINAVYNEYFWYSLFMWYYTLKLDSDIKQERWYDNVKTMTLQGNPPKEYRDPENILEYAEKIEEQMTMIEQQLFKSKQAITESLKSITELKSSFPLHIWLLMYQEDVKLFMQEIYKIYSPIRTLYDKFRNVQIKES